MKCPHNNNTRYYTISTGCIECVRSEYEGRLEQADEVIYQLSLIKNRAEEIMNQAHLKADHYAYDLMRTILEGDYSD